MRTPSITITILLIIPKLPIKTPKEIYHQSVLVGKYTDLIGMYQEEVNRV
jgi:hypothetical protein